MSKASVTRRQRTRDRGPEILPLPEAVDLALCGGKACHLARVSRLGLPVPPAFVVTNSAFQRFLDENALRPQIEARCREARADSHDSVRRAARGVREIVLEAPLADTLRAAMSAQRERLLAGRTLAVRSSAVGEDSASASFAGQLDSFLDVNSDEEIFRALRACWASYWSERSLYYQLSRGVELSGMGVLVQEQVRSRISGVLFTRHPGENTSSAEMLGEYCLGLGDQLVSGHIEPGRFTIDRRHFRWHRLTPPDRRASAADDVLLDDAQVSALARAGTILEEAFGGPQDIEWTMDENGRLLLLQSRPITTIGTPSRGPMVVWTNANVSENFPGAISPLLYSIASEGYTNYFRNLARAFGIAKRRIRAMAGPLRHIIGVHHARMYYNLTNIHAVLRMAPFGDLLARSFNEFVGASQNPAPPAKARSFAGRGRVRLSRFAELCWIVMKTTRQYLFLPRRIARFERTADAFGTRTAPAVLARKTLIELRDDMREFLDIRFNRWTDAALADAAAMVCYSVLGRWLDRALPGADHAALHHSLLKGLDGVVSNMPVFKLWELSRAVRQNDALAALFAQHAGPDILAQIRNDERFKDFRARLDEFLDQWGFRCSGELMLTVPSFQENPAAMLDLLKVYLRREDESPVDVLRRQTAQRLAETERIYRELAAKPRDPRFPIAGRARIFKRLLIWTQGAIRLRERARLKQALLYSRVRRIALAIGERLVEQGDLAHRDDVFFLTYREIDDLISGAAMFPEQMRSLVALRRAEHARLSAAPLPDVLVLPEGGYPRGDRTASPAMPPTPDGPDVLSGTGASSGQVTARATILTDVTQADRLAAGDILVTRQTDPGWGPVFFLIKGLVIERGGMLSHGAILAREYGIPTVVGVPEATRRIPQGATISVDGDSGVVRICA